MGLIDAIFDVERTINGLPAEQRLAVRQAQVAPLVAELESWMRAARAKVSRHADVGKAMDYMLKRWDTFSRFLSDGRICLTNNAAERALRDVALGRQAWLFVGSDRGGERAAAMYLGPAERCRPTRLACRRPTPDRLSSRVTAALIVAVELAQPVQDTAAA